MLITHLPPESATKTALRNATPDDVMERASEEARPDLGQWSSVEVLLAAIKDELVRARHVALVAAGGKPEDFVPTPRPGIPPKSAKTSRRQLSDEQRRALDPRLRSQPKEA
ncbi:hypothetical protein [Streptomyces fractus]|uniref:hypothetical protein n=1 Tax=Streptomyces fractus TaxID=641806 RepID=UPI003CFBB13A